MAKQKKVKEKVQLEEKQVDNSKEEIAQLRDQLARALADYKNLERRVADERVQTIRYANEELLKRLLPAFDNLYLAEKYTDDQGVRLTMQKLIESLSEVGVERVQTEGQTFNPQTMECVEVLTGEEEKVLEETRPGFILYGKVIRPAHVKVGGKRAEN